MKQTYEQRVQALAEKMAANDPEMQYAYSQYKVRGKIKSYYERWHRLSIGKKMEDARIAVAEMADAYEWGHHDGWMSKAMNFNQLDSPSLKEGKIKSGLIPDDGQETKYWKDYGDYLKSQGIEPDDGQEAGSDDKRTTAIN